MSDIVSVSSILKTAKQPSVKSFEHKIINDDARVLLAALPPESIDATITSPPYDDLRDYNKDSAWNFEIFKEIADGLLRVTKKGGVVVWVVGDKTTNGAKTLSSFRQALYFQEIGFKMYDVIIYEKSGTGPPHPRRYSNSFEYMFVLSKGKLKTVNLLKDKINKWAGVSTYGEVTRREKDGTLTKKGQKIIKPYGTRTNIWRYINGKGFTTRDKIAHEHPAIFPEKLVEDHLLSWTNKNDVVLDIFGGSGTTSKVAQLNQRHWIYTEIAKEYCQLAHARMESLNG